MGGLGHPRDVRAERMAPSVIARSHVAAPAAVALLLAGLLLGPYSVLVPGLLGLLLLSAAGSFLSARVNPFSLGFYLPTKPSWSAIAVVGLVGVLLISAAYADWRNGVGPILPRSFP